MTENFAKVYLWIEIEHFSARGMRSDTSNIPIKIKQFDADISFIFKFWAFQLLKN